MRYIVCCHQPDLFPWLGFFYKLSKSNHLVLLDHVTNNPKDPQNWVRRVKIYDAQKGSRWLSLPISKTSSNQGRGIPLHEWYYNKEHPNWINSYETLANTYKHYPYFAEIESLLYNFFFSATSQLSVLNLSWINAVLAGLSIDIDITLSSTLSINSSSNQMLLDCIKHVNGTTYLSGDGASGYLQAQEFQQSGIDVEFNKFNILPYNQPNISFVGGLSIVDAIASCGFDYIRDSINS